MGPHDADVRKWNVQFIHPLTFESYYRLMEWMRDGFKLHASFEGSPEQIQELTVSSLSDLSKGIFDDIFKMARRQARLSIDQGWTVQELPRKDPNAWRDWNNH